MSKVVFFAERNYHGAWVVYGVTGVKQYYGYTKEQAIRLYKEDCDIIEEVRKESEET